MKIPYTFTIIYNPHSAGKSLAMAKSFAENLRELHPTAQIKLAATKRPGHAEQLAYDAAIKHKNCVIISVSGDGGYHEVINGAMKAVDQKKARPICAVLPAGNANDHHSSVAKRPLLDAIKARDVEQLDLLMIKFGTRERYAHSYIGLGITPLVAIELNRHTLTRLKETWLSVKTVWKLRPFMIDVDSEQSSLDSLVIANVPKMAKYITISKNADPTDGKFEVVRWPHSTRLRRVRILLGAVFGSGPETEQMTAFGFRVLKHTPMQLDGEVMSIKKNTAVQISIAPGKLRTLR